MRQLLALPRPWPIAVPHRLRPLHLRRCWRWHRWGEWLRLLDAEAKLLAVGAGDAPLLQPELLRQRVDGLLHAFLGRAEPGLGHVRHHLPLGEPLPGPLEDRVLTRPSQHIAPELRLWLPAWALRDRPCWHRCLHDVRVHQLWAPHGCEPDQLVGAVLNGLAVEGVLLIHHLLCQQPHLRHVALALMLGVLASQASLIVQPPAQLLRPAASLVIELLS